MPVSVKDIPEWLKDGTPKEKALWVKVWNADYARNSDLEAGERVKRANGAAKAAVEGSRGKGGTSTRSPLVVDLSGLSMALKAGSGEEKSTWIEAHRIGQWFHPVYGLIEATPEFFKAMIENFKKNVLGHEPPIDWQHSTGNPEIEDPRKEGRAAGFVKDMRLNAKGVFELLIAWTVEGLEDVAKKAFRYFSCTIIPNFLDPNSGERVGPVLEGGGLTNTPFIDDLAPIELSARFKSEAIRLNLDIDQLYTALRASLDQVFPPQSFDVMVERFTTDFIVIRLCSREGDEKYFRIPYKFENNEVTLGPTEEVEKAYVPKGSPADQTKQAISQTSKSKGRTMKEKLIQALTACTSDEEAVNVASELLKQELAKRNQPSEKEIALQTQLEESKKELRTSRISSQVQELRKPSAEGKALPPATCDMVEALLKGEGEDTIRLSDKVTCKSLAEGLVIALADVRDRGLVSLGTKVPGSETTPPVSGEDDGKTLVFSKINVTPEELKSIEVMCFGSPARDDRDKEMAKTPLSEESVKAEVAVRRALRDNPKLSRMEAMRLVRTANS